MSFEKFIKMLKNSLAKMLPLRVAVIGGALEYVNRIASCDGDTTTSATPATPASLSQSKLPPS